MGGSALSTIEIDQKSVYIATPAMDSVSTAYHASMVHMVKWTLLQMPEALISFTHQLHCTSMLPWSREQLARDALEQGASHMLWIDSDMQFPQDMLLRFLRHDHPIVGINAMSRRPPYRSTAQYEGMKPVETSMESTGLEKVARTGFGVVWMETEILRSIDPPWFDFEWVPEKRCYRGEDYYFLEKAKAKGYEVYIDHDISKQVHHIGSFAFNPLLMSVIGAQERAKEGLCTPDDSKSVENP